MNEIQLKRRNAAPIVQSFLLEESAGVWNEQTPRDTRNSLLTASLITMCRAPKYHPVYQQLTQKRKLHRGQQFGIISPLLQVPSQLLISIQRRGLSSVSQGNTNNSWIFANYIGEVEEEGKRQRCKMTLSLCSNSPKNVLGLQPLLLFLCSFCMFSTSFLQAAEGSDYAFYQEHMSRAGVLRQPVSLGTHTLPHKRGRSRAVPSTLQANKQSGKDRKRQVCPKGMRKTYA